MQLSKLHKPTITASLLLLMLIALFVSRAALSITVIAFAIITIALYRVQVWHTLCNSKYVQVYLVLLGILLLSICLGGSTAAWWHAVVIKLPLIIFPLLYASITITNTARYMIISAFIILVLSGTVYSMGMYYLYSDGILNSYKYAKVLPTWLGGDHIRFSWCVVVALLLSQVQLKQMHSTKLKVINVVLQVWLCIYLHILGSKTGLVLLYTTILLGLLYAIVYLKKYTYAPYLLLLCLCPVVAYYTIPTFASRVHYMWYDYTMYSQGRYLTGLSDGARVLSIKAGLATVSTQPWLGIGYGHIDAAMAQYYKAHTALQPYEYIWPSSQWLVAATTIGVVGGSILLLCVVYPFFILRLRKQAIFYFFYIPTLITLLFEIPLEGQYGVFIFAFFTNWFVYLHNPNYNAT